MTHNAIPPFEFAGLPTRVIMAAGAIDRIAEYVHAAGGTRVMLVCGGKTGQSRLVQRVGAGLGGSMVVRFDNVTEHSGAQLVQAGARLAAEHRVDLLLAVGSTLQVFPAASVVPLASLQEELQGLLEAGFLTTIEIEVGRKRKRERER